MANEFAFYFAGSKWDQVTNKGGVGDQLLAAAAAGAIEVAQNAKMEHARPEH